MMVIRHAYALFGVATIALVGAQRPSPPLRRGRPTHPTRRPPGRRRGRGPRQARAAHLPLTVNGTKTSIYSAWRLERYREPRRPDLDRYTSNTTDPRDDCAARPGNDISALWRHLDNGLYSYRLYGATNRMPACSQLRLIWLPLIDDATLKTIWICGGADAIPEPTPQNLLYFPQTPYQHYDAVVVASIRPGYVHADLRGQFSPRGVPSESWVEVTHCPVAAEGARPFFYRMPGSGLSIFTGKVKVIGGFAEKHGARKRFDEFRGAGFDTLHFPAAVGSGEEIVSLHGLGKKATAVSGADLARLGLLLCGQPPNVRNCTAGDPALQLHAACGTYNTPGARFSDAHRDRILSATGGVHLCQGGDSSVVDPTKPLPPRRGPRGPRVTNP